MSKASQDTDIPRKIIKVNADISSGFLLSGFNNSIRISIFPSSLKQAVITQVLKRGDKSLKESYGPVSILPNISKIFERSLFKQFLIFENLSSQSNSVFSGYNTQYYLLSMLEKWKSAVDKVKYFVTLLTDLSSLWFCFSQKYTCKTTCVWF